MTQSQTLQKPQTKLQELQSKCKKRHWLESVLTYEFHHQAYQLGASGYRAVHTGIFICPECGLTDKRYRVPEGKWRQTIPYAELAEKD